MCVGNVCVRVREGKRARERGVCRKIASTEGRAVGVEQETKQCHHRHESRADPGHSPAVV